MKRILLAVLTTGAVAGVAVFATNAFFSDTETSTANTFTAGQVDLKIDSECRYFTQEAGENEPTNKGCNGFGLWTSTDLNQEKFFSFADVKPGDYGENTLSFTVATNPVWACMRIGNLTNLENGLTDPEVEAGDTSDPQGELAANLHFTAWLDQGTIAGWQGKGKDSGEGDNVWQGQAAEPLLFSNQQGPASDVLGGKTYALSAPTGALWNTPITANEVNYLGLQWCAGSMSIVGNVISCDGSTMDNQSQTDSLTADVSFYVVQSRNNPQFSCDTVWVSPTPSVSPISNP